MKKLLVRVLMPLLLFAMLLTFAVGGKAGFGPCTKCECKSFEGSGSHCDDCGHTFADHS